MNEADKFWIIVTIIIIIYGVLFWLNGGMR